jgi:hypothetical protein
MIRDVHSGPRSQARIFFRPGSSVRIPNTGVKKAQKAPDPGSGSATLEYHAKIFWFYLEDMLLTQGYNELPLDLSSSRTLASNKLAPSNPRAYASPKKASSSSCKGE